MSLIGSLFYQTRLREKKEFGTWIWGHGGRRGRHDDELLLT